MAQTIAKKTTKAKVQETAVKSVASKKVAAVKPVVAKKAPEVKTVQVKTAKYSNKNIQMSPRKLRLMADSIRKLNPAEVLVQLKFTNSKAARVMVAAIKTVIADAKNNFGMNVDTLKFDTVKVDEGLKIKRMDKSHGSRFASGRIMKRHSRLEIIVKGETN